jgi:uncharacterized membrane protein
MGAVPRAVDPASTGRGGTIRAEQPELGAGPGKNGAAVAANDKGHLAGIDTVLHVIEYVAVAIEVLAVAVITVFIVWATVVYLTRRLMRRDPRDAEIYQQYRQQLGSGLLLGLEILVAADIVRTVALDPSLDSAIVLGLLVLIRTFLSWSLVVEMEHRWPWERHPDQGNQS